MYALARARERQLGVYLENRAAAICERVCVRAQKLFASIPADYELAKVHCIPGRAQQTHNNNHNRQSREFVCKMQMHHIRLTHIRWRYAVAATIPLVGRAHLGGCVCVSVGRPTREYAELQRIRPLMGNLGQI